MASNKKEIEMAKRHVIKKGIVTAYGRNWERKPHEEHGFRAIPKFKGERVGLYVLYKKKDIVYIGKSEKNIRMRLMAHTKDRYANAWDYFSWFITKIAYTSDLEALLHKIFHDITKVTLNRIKAGFQEAKKYSGKRIDTRR